MDYRFCSVTNAFYPFALINEYKKENIWPENSVDVDECVFIKYSGLPPAGKVRGSTTDGMPTWIDVPPPTHAELVAIAEQRVKTLLAEATIIIGPLADAQAGGYIDDNDVPRLTEWQRYRYRLTKVDTSTAPDITLPPRPEV